MHASVRTYQAVDVEKLLDTVEAEFVVRVKAIDGLIGYYVIDGGDGTVTSITLGDTPQAVEASTRTAPRRGWLKAPPTSSQAAPP
jgi:hypothetical protein